MDGISPTTPGCGRTSTSRISVPHDENGALGSRRHCPSGDVRLRTQHQPPAGRHASDGAVRIRHVLHPRGEFVRHASTRSTSQGRDRGGARRPWPRRDVARGSRGGRGCPHGDFGEASHSQIVHSRLVANDRSCGPTSCLRRSRRTNCPSYTSPRTQRSSPSQTASQNTCPSTARLCSVSETPRPPYSKSRRTKSCTFACRMDGSASGRRIARGSPSLRRTCQRIWHRCAPWVRVLQAKPVKDSETRRLAGYARTAASINVPGSVSDRYREFTPILSYAYSMARSSIGRTRMPESARRLRGMEPRAERIRRGVWAWLPGSRCNQAQLDGLLNELRVGLDAKELHDAVLVELDRSRTDVEQRRNLLHGFPLREELEYFPLPRTQ